MNIILPSGHLTIRAAAVQLCSGPDVTYNLQEAATRIHQAADAGAHLVALPEYFPLMSAHDGDKLNIAEQEGQGRLQTFLSQTAQKYKIWLAGGTIPLKGHHPDKVRNTTLVFNPQGEQIACYDKIHLFGFQSGEEHYDESRLIEPGKKVITFDSPIGPTGLSICYDLRFPELFRMMGKVNLIILPAAFTYTTGKAHWEILLRARAIENQCYVLAPAQGGTHPHGRVTWGHSMIINPWGEILACCTASGAGMVVAELDLAYLNTVRTSLPALNHCTLPVQ